METPPSSPADEERVGYVAFELTQGIAKDEIVNGLVESGMQKDSALELVERIEAEIKKVGKDAFMKKLGRVEKKSAKTRQSGLQEGRRRIKRKGVPGSSAKSPSPRWKGWVRIAGIFFAFIVFGQLHPYSGFVSLFPWNYSSVAVAWFVAFAIIGFFEDVEERGLEMAYLFTLLVFAVTLLPIFQHLSGDATLRILLDVILWPLGLLLESQWGNLLALAGLMLFGTLAGNLARGLVASTWVKKR